MTLAPRIVPRPIPIAVAFALGTLSASPALAQSGDRPGDVAPLAANENPAMTLGDVVVSDGNLGPLSTRRVLTSVDVVPAERIERQQAANNWELFNQVPGAQLTRFNQGTTSGKFSMRGFNGEGEINAVKLLIDGIPSNSNDGNMPYIDLAPLLDIEAIEVVRGTNDPRYGLHNIAGNATIVTRRGGNYGLGRAAVGSFGTRSLQGALGIDNGTLSQNYAIGWNSTNGHRDHSQADGLSLGGKWFVSPDNGRTRIGLIARHYRADAEEAGYLTAAQRSANPDQSPAHNASDEDRRRVSQLALQAETQFTPSLFGAAQAWLNDLDDRRFVRFSAGVSQQERYVAERHVGASANLTWRAGRTAIGDVAVTGGVDVERQDNRSERYNTGSQVRTARTRDQQFDFDTIGMFVQAAIKPTAALTIVPAWRVDRISGNYHNRLNGQTYDVNDYGNISQPKLSAVFAVSDALSVYGNWGRTFQVGVGTASYKVNQTNDLEPSINQGWETGIKFRPLPWLDGRVALWEQTASNEARRRLNDPSNDAENIGKTRRRGIDLQLNARPMPGLALWVATAIQRSKILVADAASVGTQGKEIDHVPHLLVNFGADWRIDETWRVSGWGSGASSYFLERTNATGSFGSQFTLDASVAYRVSRQFELELQVRNLTDRYNEYVWWDGTQSLHAPAPGRSVYLVAHLKY